MDGTPAESDSITAGRSAHESPSFSLKNRCARALWNAVWIVFFRFTPRPFHWWRALLLRTFGASIGSDCHIYPGARIWAPWNLHCDSQCAIADGAIIYNQAKITMGARAVISQGAHLCCGTHKYKSRLFELLAYPITIGPDAWVCAEAFIGPGVTIHEGAVIGARAVVIRDMPAWTVCGGHPCKPIKPYTRA